MGASALPVTPSRPWDAPTKLYRRGGVGFTDE